MTRFDEDNMDMLPQTGTTTADAAVEVCPLCDIAGCRHIRERNASAATPPVKGEGEPVAWQWRFRVIGKTVGEWTDWYDGKASDLYKADYDTEERPLYTHPDTQEIARLRAAVAKEVRTSDGLYERLSVVQQEKRGAEARLAEVEAERQVADDALVDKYRAPKSGSFDFPGDVAAIIRKLEGERDAALAQVAGAYEAAAQAAKDCAPPPAGGPLSHTNTFRVAVADCVNVIRALTPADATAALDRMIADRVQAAHDYALSLAKALRARLFPHQNNWRPLPDILGLLTQIDNMAASIPPQAALAAQGEPWGWWARDLHASKGSIGFLINRRERLAIATPVDEWEITPLYAHPAPASAGVTVKPLVLSEARKLWLQHGGRVTGPRVETWGMPEANVMGFLAALTTAQSVSEGGE